MCWALGGRESEREREDYAYGKREGPEREWGETFLSAGARPVSRLVDVICTGEIFSTIPGLVDEVLGSWAS